MKTFKNTIIVLVMFFVGGCYQAHDARIHVREEIRSDTLDNNFVTRTVGHAFGALTGEGIDITQAVTRRNDAGFLELHISGFNRSHETKRFRYRVEWLDENGFQLQTTTSTWLPASSMGKSPFSLKAISPNTKAVNFRMDTKKWE